MIAVLSNFSGEVWSNSFWLLSFVVLRLLKLTRFLRGKSLMLAKSQIKAKSRKRFWLILMYCVLLIVLWVWNDCPAFLFDTCVSRCWEGSTYVASSCKIRSFLIIISTIPRYLANTSEPNLARGIEDRNRHRPLRWFNIVEKRMWTCKLARGVLLYGWTLFNSFSISATPR
jgi:hypothetical protein